jgi:Protein of unknown function (DUF1553)/Protein of unknown function (DUF1549)
MVAGRAGVLVLCRFLLSPAEAANPAVAKSELLFQAGQTHWAFQPVTHPIPPAVKDPSWVRNAIDRFVLAALEADGIRPAPPAGKETLIRRVSLDLTGLPPDPQEVEIFLEDRSESAYPRLVERLLASPRYGERWGRHWLDLARFAESDGFEHDAIRPQAWRYRDYVIRAFNEDKPYDQFIREQVAGDELYPNSQNALIATAFNLLGPDMVDSSDQIQRRLNTLNDMTDTTGLAFLGLTVGCARCHDHKFEPISQRDYYGLEAFFTPEEFRHDLPVPTEEERAAYDLARKDYERRAGALRERIDREQNDKERKRWQNALKELPKPKPLPATLGLQKGKKEIKTFVLTRGDYNRPTKEVQPAFPAVLAGLDVRKPGPPPPQRKERAALARWLASPNNPLTARVMANRIWQHHFGRGLVTTPSDFGLRGQPPSHPELLDWLASEFMARGWSLKEMHRLILLSATYRQSGQASPETLAGDPGNRLFSRWQPKRMEAEVVRDSLLAISGRLNLAMGGPSVFPPIPADLFQGAQGWQVSGNQADHHRRSVYIFARRNLRFPFLEVFDAPDSNLSCPERGESTTAPQALTLLNAEEVLVASRATADHIEKDASTNAQRIERAYRLILARPPSSKERALSRRFLTDSPLSELCRALFNLNAFVYVE